MTTLGKPILAHVAFLEGDEVVLTKGTYTGTPGIFLRYRADLKWADISESSGILRSHPVSWLAHREIRRKDEIVQDHRG